MPRKYARKKKQSFASKVKAIVNKQAERKRISYTWNLSQASTTGTDTALLSSITQGDGPNNRDGHEIRLSYLSADLFLTCNDTTNVVRVIIYRKKTADTLATDGLSVYGVIDPDKYIIMKDDLLTLSQTGDSFVRRRKYRFALKNRKARYDASTGAPAIGDDIHVYYVSDSGISAHPTLSGHWLMYYYDL